MATITSANSVFSLSFDQSIVRVFNGPQQLQGFAADDVFTIDILATAETLMGVDGMLSAGFVFTPIVQHISLQADSLSNVVFEVWYQTQLNIREAIFVQGTVMLPTLVNANVLPSANLKYATSNELPMRVIYELYNGVLTNYPVIPDVARTLRPRRYTVTWERVGAKPNDGTISFQGMANVQLNPQLDQFQMPNVGPGGP